MENNISDLNNLYEGYRATLRACLWKTDPQRFEADFLHGLCSISRDIQNRIYKTQPCSEFQINERGRTRIIHGNTVRDKIVRHTLCDTELNPAIQPYLIYNNGASQKGKGLLFARSQFEKDLHNYYLKYGTNEGYIGFMDFSKYYDNIVHDYVKQIFKPIINEEAFWLVTEILRSYEVDVSYMSYSEFANCMTAKFDSLDYHSQIPMELRTGKKFMAKSANIGDQGSQTIGVFYPTRIDNYVKIVRGVKFYGRYMDDLYIISQSKEELESIMRGVYKIARSIGIFINFKKTKILKLSDRFTYLQIRYFLSDTGKVVKRIAPITLTRERARLRSYANLLNKGEISFETISMAYKSWMGSFASLMSKQQIKNMKQLFYELFKEDVRWKK